MNSKHTGRKVVDPVRADPDSLNRRNSQQLLGRFQTPVVRERARTPRKAIATVALMLVAAVALVGSIVASYYALPLLDEFSDGCKKLSEKDVVRVFDARTTTNGFRYDPPHSAGSASAGNVVAEGDMCIRYVVGSKDDAHASGNVIARTQTDGDATAVFRREREKAATRDPRETGTLKAFFLSDTRLGDEAFCTVAKEGYNSVHGVLVRFGDKVVYAHLPTIPSLSDGGNCDLARRLANELR